MNDIFSKKDYSLYSNAMTFMRQPLCNNPLESRADVVVVGAPLDIATSGRPGARLGPDAIRKASVNLAWEEKKFPWSFNVFEHINVVDMGDLVFDPGDAQDFTERYEFLLSQLIKNGKTVLGFGGDHFITLPALRAYHKEYGQMALIHFDAHTDTYSNGSQFDHGTMFYHAPKEGLISATNSVQIGIRTEYEDKDHGFNVISAPQANQMSIEEISFLVKKVVKDMPVYLTFDIDCLDPAYAPGTGTPVCGGLTTDKVLSILRALDGINLVGMDVVEVSPAYDHADITSLAAATVALEMLYLWGSKRIPS
ncbi:agmatinase [Vibrio sp. HN007]|uniref:agmatinase n=1 Tax=Vibrio iocasae TaxID=3098914 RepID=UPI0035D499FE